jgi:Flp pilus assembly protein TadG
LNDVFNEILRLSRNTFFQMQCDFQSTSYCRGVSAMQSLRTFKKNCNGNVAIMFGLALVPLTLASGVAIDMVQTNRSLTVLQGAVDAATIAGATSGGADAAATRATVEAYLKANGAEWVLDEIDEIKPVMNKAQRTYSVRITGKRNTSFMHLAGIDQSDLGAYAEVKLGGDGLEVAMVLDNTASMSASGRMPALKDAAHSFVDGLMDIEKTGAYVRVGIVPFAQYVNVGMSRRNESWLNVPDDYTTTSSYTPYTYPDFREYDCVFVPDIVDGVDTGNMKKSCKYDYGVGIPGTPYDVSYDHKWYGCVGSRTEPLDAEIGALTTRYPGLMDTSCVSELVDLTDDKAKLKSTIDGMVTVGETYIPAGLLWGWNMLHNNKPLETAKPAAAIKVMGGTKALILMTDGGNTLANYAPYHWGDNPADAPRGNEKMETLCENIKKDGIVVFTVSFMVTEPDAEARMQACASDPSKAYDADSSVSLSKAFDSIGSTLAALRLSR